MQNIALKRVTTDRPVNSAVTVNVFTVQVVWVWTVRLILNVLAGKVVVLRNAQTAPTASDLNVLPSLIATGLGRIRIKWFVVKELAQKI